MTRSIALSLLAQGNTGNELLSILESIATEDVEVDIIEFWWYNEGGSVILWATLIRLSSYSWWQYVALDGCVGGGRSGFKNR